MSMTARCRVQRCVRRLRSARRSWRPVRRSRPPRPAIIAQAERHGDGGAQVLADAAGLSRRDAHSQVNTAEAIGAVPAVRDAVEAGRVSQANAKRLADAVREDQRR